MTLPTSLPAPPPEGMPLTEARRLAVLAISRTPLIDTPEETASRKRWDTSAPCEAALITQTSRAQAQVALYARLRTISYAQAYEEVVSAARKLRDTQHAAFLRWAAVMREHGNDPLEAYKYLSTARDRDDQTEKYAQAADLTYEEACQELLDSLWQFAYVVGLGEAKLGRAAASTCLALVREAQAVLSPVPEGTRS